MGCDAGALIDDGEVIVFVEHPELEPGQGRLVRCLGHVELDFGAFEDGEGLVRRRSVVARVAGLDQALDPGAGEVIEGAREHGIEPSAAAAVSRRVAIVGVREASPIQGQEYSNGDRGVRDVERGEVRHLMKSTTSPSFTRSMRLPTAPPSMSASPSRMSGWANDGLKRKTTMAAPHAEDARHNEKRPGALEHSEGGPAVCDVDDLQRPDDSVGVAAFDGLALTHLTAWSAPMMASVSKMNHPSRGRITARARVASRVGALSHSSQCTRLASCGSKTLLVPVKRQPLR